MIQALAGGAVITHIGLCLLSLQSVDSTVFSCSHSKRHTDLSMSGQANKNTTGTTVQREREMCCLAGSSLHL